MINMMLITVASFLVVDTAYQVTTERFDSFQVSEIAPKAVNRSHAKRPLSLSYYNTIKTRDIFKSSQNDKKPEDSVNVDSLKETELKLKLWGTVTGDREKAYAVIGETTRNKEQELYRIGDTIQNTSATVKMILREKVVLSINDEDQVLVMEEAKSTKKDSADSRAPALSNLSDGMEPGSTQNISLQRADIEQSLQNINELMGQVKVRPHFTNGQPDGLALSSIRRNSIFSQMGLKNGDVITGVDGNPIESVDDALKFYENISSASALSLQVKRRGKMQTIDYNIQ
ncbi:MAG: PDZ domain-containing protein [Proteobacteria bacterium]|nr:PDZ domain-containing protein [Pseudomonadota bacterium]